MLEHGRIVEIGHPRRADRGGRRLRAPLRRLGRAARPELEALGADAAGAAGAVPPRCRRRPSPAPEPGRCGGPGPARGPACGGGRRCGRASVPVSEPVLGARGRVELSPTPRRSRLSPKSSAAAWRVGAGASRSRLAAPRPRSVSLARRRRARCLSSASTTCVLERVEEVVERRRRPRAAGRARRARRATPRVDVAAARRSRDAGVAGGRRSTMLASAVLASAQIASASLDELVLRRASAHVASWSSGTGDWSGASSSPPQRGERKRRGDAEQSLRSGASSRREGSKPHPRAAVKPTTATSTRHRGQAVALSSCGPGT